MPDFPNVFLLRFAPEQWTALEKLVRLVGPPLPNDSNVRIGLRDCLRHLDKVTVLWRITSRLRSNLALDREELERLGGTSNAHSEEYAATCEGIICALYSALDGFRTFVFGCYRNVQGVQNGSNGKLFERATDSKYGVGFPEKIRSMLAFAHKDWFSELREFRTELTHGSTGSCHLDSATNRVMYMNEGIKRGDRVFINEDIEELLHRYEARIRELVDSVAMFHLAKLEPAPMFHMCGMYRFRWYGRMVLSKASINSQDGHCLSYDWFEKEDGYFCPLASRCEAYKRKWPGGSASLASAKAAESV
jgi:hypothetical protein